jgi:crossover junction endodeoxyribonuclease RuvC
MNKYLGLDLSLTSTGCSFGDNRTVIATKARGAERLHVVSSSIVQLCIDEGITVIAIEGYSFASRNSQAHSIGELGGAVRMRLWENGVPYVDIPPTSRAKFGSGRGNAGKGEVMSAVSAKTGLVFAGAGADDMCDAFVLEEMLRYKFGDNRYDWGVQNVASLDKVDWSPIQSLIPTNVKE